MTPEDLTRRAEGTLPDFMGLEVVAAGKGFLEARMPIRKEMLAPNGFLHAASVVCLADSCCGYGCVSNLPEGGKSFATIELKSNFLSTLREGVMFCRAEMAHGGGTTQVWDAVVSDEATGKRLALFRCTQMILR